MLYREGAYFVMQDKITSTAVRFYRMSEKEVNSGAAGFGTAFAHDKPSALVITPFVVITTASDIG